MTKGKMQRDMESKLAEREQTTIRLPLELKEKLQKQADERGIPLHDLIVFNLWRYFECTAQE